MTPSSAAICLSATDALQDIAADKNAEADVVIDAAGCAVLPGFVQTHIHLCQTLFRGAADDLSLLDWLKKRVWPMEAAHTAAQSTGFGAVSALLN